VSAFATTDLAGTWWQYVALFVLVTASWAGVPFIGATAAGAAGVAASQGRLNVAVVIIVTVIAGEVGGLIGYGVGNRFGRRLLERPGRHQAGRVKLVERGEAAYAKWGRLAVFFTPSVVSGTAHMPFAQFVLWNLIDSVSFAVSVVASAYGLGRVVTGHTSPRDIAFLVIGLAAGAVFVLLLARRHHRRAETAGVEEEATRD
jgi:membrane protein DedA with SNARE-associated domain